MSDYCPLQKFKVQKVMSKNKLVMDYSNYFTVSSKRILKINQQASEKI